VIVTLSAIVLFAILSFVMVRARRVSWGAFLIVFVFGFLVAGTGFAPAINSGLTSVASLVGAPRP
jgi:hypothetical protein